MSKICVFGSSSPQTSDVFRDAASQVGNEIAKIDGTCVNGGGKFGVMGALNVACRNANGKILGIIHQKFLDLGGGDTEITNMIVCKGDDLVERKQLLMQKSDCILSLPGGPGTFSELWDAVVNKSLDFLSMGAMPICILNVDGYYNGTLEQMRLASSEKLLYGNLEDYFHVETDPVAAVQWCDKEVRKLQLQQQDESSHLHQVQDSYSSARGTTSVATRQSNLEAALHQANNKTITNTNNTNPNADTSTMWGKICRPCYPGVTVNVLFLALALVAMKKQQI